MHLDQATALLDDLGDRGPVLGVVGQHGRQEGKQLGGRSRQIGYGRRIGHHVEQHVDVVRVVRQVTCRGEQQNRTECVHVDGARQRLHTVGLLGRHARRGAYDRVGGGEGGTRLGEDSEAEVDDLGTVRAEQDVRGLQIPVQQSLLVHISQALGKGGAERQDEEGGQWAVRHHMLAEVRPLHVLGGQPGLFRVRVRVEELRDPRTPDSLQDLDLLREAQSSGRIDDRWLDDLHRGWLTAWRLAQIHLPHAALADPAQQLEAADLCRIFGAERRRLHVCPSVGFAGWELSKRFRNKLADSDADLM